jgi:transglutaminase-like putative cysteine protease
VAATDVRPRAGVEPQPAPARPSSSAPSRALVVAELLMFVGLAVVAALAYEPVFASWGTFVGPVIGAVAVATLLSIGLNRRRIPARFAVLASLVGVTLYLSYTVLVRELTAGVVPGPDTLDAIRDGLAHGWRDILDESLPVMDPDPPLVWLCVVVWVVTHLTADLVQRTRLVAMPVVPPLVLLGLCLPLVSATDEPPLWLVAAFIALALAGILVRAAPTARAVRPAGRASAELTEFHSRSVLSARLRLGLPIVAAVAIAAPIVGQVVTTREPFDPRSLRNEVTLPESVADPLGQLKAQLEASPPRPAFRVEFAGATDVVDVRRVSVLHLDQYDGVRWTSTGRFGTARTPLVADADLAPGRDVTQRYTIGTTDDPWIPAAGQPVRIDLPDVAYDPAGGDLLATGSVSGLSYEVVSRVGAPSTDEIAAASAADDDDLARYLELDGDLPEAIRTEAVDATTGATSDGDAVLRLEQFLRTGYAYDPDAVAGHSYGRLTQFLTEDRRGTAEQFAASYVVLARSLGLPSRVVVGYRVAEEQDGELVGLDFVTSEHYHAWAQVKLDGLGWVTVDPTPREGDTPLPEQPEEPPATTVAPPQQPGGERVPEESGPSEGLPEPDPPAESVGSRLAGWVVAGLGAVALLLAAAAGGIVFAKQRRRARRRNAPTSADRVVGAWDELVDRLVEMHFPIGESMTPRDVARLGFATYGTATAEPLGRLVPEVSGAVFARDEPSPADADTAWERTEQFEQNLAATLTRRQRLRARLSLRPFRR